MIDFDVLGDNIREFFSQRQKALLISCVLIVFFCAALSLAFLSCAKIGNEKMKAQKVMDAKSGVYYSLFTRSFADSNGDGIGDAARRLNSARVFGKPSNAGKMGQPGNPRMACHSRPRDC